MNKYEITKKIEKFAPIETAEAWDCVGFMTETQKQEISKVMLCLTPTTDVIHQALKQNCDMIIAHHPMFYINFDSELVSNKFYPKIDIYSAHTNLDKAQGGTTDAVIQNLNYTKYLIPTEHEFIRIIEFEKEIPIEEFSKNLANISPNARIINNKKITKLKRVAFCAGSGSEFINDAKNLNADCLVTGDIKFHTALDSDIVLYDIGHFDSEILILPVIEKIIGNQIEIVYAKEESPFKLI